MEKTKFTIYVEPETMARIEKLYAEDGCTTRTAFIEKAINFYCGYLTSENYKDYFPSVILTSVKGTLDSFENRMAALLFKLAVEMSMMLHVTAATSEIDEENLLQLRGMCVNEVKKLNGRITFDDAYRFQNS